jgi:hypothetical protein
MPDPEIDRRCAVCGASVRPRAMFCPQCGQQQVKESKPQSGKVAPVKSALESDRTVEIPREAIPDLSETQPLIALQPAKSETAATQPISAKQDPPQVAPGPAGNVRGRVEKLRKASSLVIDQAAYDPSLRFILVGAAFFLLFLFLLLLSKVLG